MKPKSVTLYDVARHAGVSYQTVSRVINQASHVSEKTRLRVEAAMAELHYVPNRVAQQLAGKLSQTIGLATTSFALHAPSQIAAAIKSRADELKFNVVISMVETSGPEAVKAAVNSLLAQRVDGILINIPLDEQQAIATAQLCARVPALFLDVSPQTRVNQVIFNPFLGAQLGAEHLINLGHRQIALLTGPLSSVSARLRYQGWLQRLAADNLRPLAVMHGDWSSSSGYQETRRLLQDGLRPQSILVANDQMALGTLRALSEFGLAVPAEVSVVGYDDTEDSACFIPPLTTIKQDFRQLGQSCVDRLLALIHGETGTSVMLPVSMVERRTTAAPGASVPSAEALAEALSRLSRQVARLR